MGGTITIQSIDQSIQLLGNLRLPVQMISSRSIEQERSIPRPQLSLAKESVESGRYRLPP